MCIFWEVDEPSDGPPHPYPRELLLLLQMLQWKGWRNGGEQTAELLPRKDFAGQKRQGEELPFFGGNANLKRPLASNAWQPSLLSPLLSVQTSGGITCAGGSGSNFRSWFRINLIYSLISCGGKKNKILIPGVIEPMTFSLSRISTLPSQRAMHKDNKRGIMQKQTIQNAEVRQQPFSDPWSRTRLHPSGALSWQTVWTRLLRENRIALKVIEWCPLGSWPAPASLGSLNNACSAWGLAC